MASTNAVAKVADEPKSLVTDELAQLYQENAGMGKEDLRKEDYALPFLKILQGLSPELQRGDKFIPGAATGDLINSVSGEVFPGDKGVRVVRVLFETKWLEWRPRKAGGGLVKVSSSKEEAEAARQPIIGNPDTDTEIIDTAQIYCLVETSSGWQPAILAWTKTKWKAARLWNSLTNEQTWAKLNQRFGLATPLNVDPSASLPHLAMVYRLKTATTTNTKGTFATPVIDRTDITPTPANVFRLAKDFRDLIKAGKVEVKHENLGEEIADVELDVPGGEDLSPSKSGF